MCVPTSSPLSDPNRTLATLQRRERGQNRTNSEKSVHPFAKRVEGYDSVAPETLSPLTDSQWRDPEVSSRRDDANVRGACCVCVLFGM